MYLSRVLSYYGKRSYHTFICTRGLNEFVETGKLVETGRTWTRVELRKKSNDDLEKLWWVCIKERNRIATLRYREATSWLPGWREEYGVSRRWKVGRTMKNIKWVLREREIAQETKEEQQRLLQQLEEAVDEEEEFEEVDNDDGKQIIQQEEKIR